MKLEIEIPEELEPAAEKIEENITIILNLMKKHVENGVSPNLAFRMAIQDYLFGGGE